jgi:hypothetical protein
MDFVAMILQKYMSGLSLAEIGQLAIFASGHQRPPHLGISFVLHHFHTIKPMFDVVAVYTHNLKTHLPAQKAGHADQLMALASASLPGCTGI